MTDTKQPEALRLAVLLELAPEDGVEPQTTEDASAELRRLHAENTALQAGYAAARLEIESLRGRSGEPVGESPALPEPDTHCFDDDTQKSVWSYSEGLVRSILASDRAMRAAQPAGAPQPVEREPLTDEQIESLLWKYGYDPDDTQMAAMLKEARGIKGGQHGAE